MAGSITATPTDIGGGYVKYSVAWTSDASGNVSANGFSVRRGRLANVKYIPGASSAQPSDLYDLTLLDADGADVVGGGGANLSNATAAFGAPATVLEAGTLTPTIANAGNAKGGTLVLYVGP